MLNNQDFSKLLSQPDKVRFDLKQIETWDKQNEARLKKKSLSTAKNATTESNDGSSKEGNAYRDRAEERRKHIVSEEQLHLENIASQLNAEQSKFLGGDLKHTHLVKGLDYALLRKNRDHSEIESFSSVNQIASNTLNQRSIKPNVTETVTRPYKDKI